MFIQSFFFFPVSNDYLFRLTLDEIKIFSFPRKDGKTVWNRRENFAIFYADFHGKIIKNRDTQRIFAPTTSSHAATWGRQSWYIFSASKSGWWTTQACFCPEVDGWAIIIASKLQGRWDGGIRSRDVRAFFFSWLAWEAYVNETEMKLLFFRMVLPSLEAGKVIFLITGKNNGITNWWDSVRFVFLMLCKLKDEAVALWRKDEL